MSPAHSRTYASRLCTRPCAVGRTRRLANEREHDAVAEVEDVLRLQRKLLEGTRPFVEEGTDRCRTLVQAHPVGRGVVHTIVSAAAHHRVHVTAIRRFELSPRQLDQVGGRGCLGHRPPSIPRTLPRRGVAPTQTPAANAPSFVPTPSALVGHALLIIRLAANAQCHAVEREEVRPMVRKGAMLRLVQRRAVVAPFGRADIARVEVENRST
jgi:hypothetical protein